METYSRLRGELQQAREHVNQLQREAAAQRLLRSEGDTAVWRKRLAAGLHGLADRLEPAAYHEAKGNPL